MLLQFYCQATISMRTHAFVVRCWSCDVTEKVMGTCWAGLTRRPEQPWMAVGLRGPLKWPPPDLTYITWPTTHCLGNWEAVSWGWGWIWSSLGSMNREVRESTFCTTCAEQLLPFRSKSLGTLTPKFSCETPGRKNSYRGIVKIILSKKCAGLFKQAASMRLSGGSLWDQKGRSRWNYWRGVATLVWVLGDQLQAPPHLTPGPWGELWLRLRPHISHIIAVLSPSFTARCGKKQISKPQ